MKKTSKLFGAVALSAALAVGTAVPAFAAPQTNADGDFEPVVDWNKDAEGNIDPEEIEDGADGASSTPVFIDVNKSNINVAVPIELRVVAESAGGNLLCPSDGVYGVWNYSTNTAVYINKVEVQYNDDANANGENWELVTDATQVGSGVEAANAKLGNLMVTLTAPDAAADTYVLDVAAAKVPTQAQPWKINKSGFVTEGDGTQTPTGTKFALNFDAAGSQSSIVQDADAANLMSQGNGADKTAANAFKLKYTISTAKPKA